MKKLKGFIAIIMTVIFTLTSAFAAVPDQNTTAKANSKENKITDRFIVKYKQDNRTDKIEKSMSKEVKNLKKLKNKKYNVLQTNKKMTTEELIEVLEMQGILDEIEYIQEDNIIETFSNDPYFNEQWGLQNNAATVTGEVYGIDANISEAWNITQGEGVVVGVIDTGIDINHEDLKNNIWVNSDEIPGDGIDQDGNGYVDDVNGWNFADDNNDIYDESDSIDEAHGTALAGIIAAEKDNGAGIAGVAPKAKVMPLKVFKDGQAYTSDILEAIEYAKTNGVKIVNCSWGSSEYNQALREAIADSEILFACAAGNNGANVQQSPVYPACFGVSNIISVASINISGGLSSFSNYSNSLVDIAAPGEEIKSTIPDNQYSKKNGTSIAVAFVSGEAALVLSKSKEAATKDIKNRIIDNADKTAALESKVKGGRRINYLNAITGNGITPASGTNSGTIADTVYGDEYGFSLMSMEEGYSAPQDVIAPVFSLPSNTANGQMKMSVLGNTVTNLLGSTGDCEELSKWTDWQITHRLDNVNKVFGSNSVRLNLAATVGNLYGAILIPGQDNTKYYTLSAYVKNGNATSIQAIISTNGTGKQYKGSAIVTDNTKFNRVTAKLQPSDWGAGSTHLEIHIQLKGESGQHGYVDGVMINEITQAEYNDPNYNPPDYVNGAKSTRTLGVKSISKNMIRNGNVEYGADYWKKLSNTSFEIENGKFKVTSTDTKATGIHQIIAVKPNTNYFITGIGSGGNVNKYIYVWNDYFGGTLLRNGSGVFNTGNNTKITVQLVVGPAGYGYFDHIQLEEGTAGTIYEPCYESDVYLPSNIELNSIYDGFEDELYVDSNTLIKRTSKILLDNSFNWDGFNNTQFSTLYYASVTGWGSQNNALPNPAKLLGYNSDFVITKSDAFVDSGQAQAAIGPDGKLWIGIPRNKIGGTTGYTADLTGFINYLTDTGMTLIYKLAQPQISNINIQSPTCYEKGTIIIERAVKDTSNYSSGISIKNTNLPIKEIESIHKIDGALRTPASTSSVVIASDGLSFTITGAQNGDTYEYIYRYADELSTLPVIRYSVPTDSTSQSNGNTEAINMLQTKVDNLEQRIKALEDLIKSGIGSKTIEFQYDANGNLQAINVQ